MHHLQRGVPCRGDPGGRRTHQHLHRLDGGSIQDSVAGPQDQLQTREIQKLYQVKHLHLESEREEHSIQNQMEHQWQSIDIQPKLQQMSAVPFGKIFYSLPPGEIQP